MKKKSGLHYGMALSMFILFLGQVYNAYTGDRIIFVVTALALLSLAAAHLILGIRKRNE